MNKEQLGAYIAGNRKAAGQTQKELASRLHITDKAVSKWERGLSYPDVTLLEPLAEALGMGVEELLSCQLQASCQRTAPQNTQMEGEDVTEETMKTLLDISSASVKAEKRRGWSRLAAVLVLLLTTALGIFCAVTFQSGQEARADIQLKDTVEGENYLYIKDPNDPGHLLQLKCGSGVNFDAIQLIDERGNENLYRMSYRWNRWTRRGVVTTCEASEYISLGGLMDVTFETERAWLFGDTLSYTSENYYPDPYGEPRGKVYLCDYRFWAGDIANGTDRTVLLVEDCLTATVMDLDGDKENEVVVRTRWPEKLYTVYDMVDGEITETWPDTVPEAVRVQLRCVWEQ